MHHRRTHSAFTYPLLTGITVVCLASAVTVAGVHIARDLRGDIAVPSTLALVEANAIAPQDEPAPPEPSPPELPAAATETPEDSGQTPISDEEPAPEVEPQDSPQAEEPSVRESDDTPAEPSFIPRKSASPPPTFAVSAEALATDLATARSILLERSASAPPGSATARDLAFVISLGETYIDQPAPAGRRRAIELTTLVNAWWFDRWARGPKRPAIARDARGLVYTYRAGRGFALNPVATTGRWQQINADVPAAALADALLEVSVEHRDREREFLLWEYYDVPDQPGVVRPGASGMAQGRLASLLAEAYSLSADDRYADGALGALAAFTVPVDRGGVLSRPESPETGLSGPWYVERAYPGESAWKGAALNGFMVTILNLRGTRKRLAVDDADRADQAEQIPAASRARTDQAARIAEKLADDGAETLRTFLPLHDTGQWSRYGLLTPGHAFGAYLADVNYHCYHISLLEQLDRIYPNHGFGVTSRRWDGYVADVDLDCATDRTRGAQS